MAFKVFPTNKALVAAWASQTYPQGRNSGGSLHFDGPTLFSYREPIARFLPTGEVQLTTQKFSVTTSQHCGLVRQECRSNVFTVLGTKEWNQ